MTRAAVPADDVPGRPRRTPTTMRSALMARASSRMPRAASSVRTTTASKCSSISLVARARLRRQHSKSASDVAPEASTRLWTTIPFVSRAAATSAALRSTVPFASRKSAAATKVRKALRPLGTRTVCLRRACMTAGVDPGYRGPRASGAARQTGVIFAVAATGTNASPPSRGRACVPHDHESHQ